MANEQGVTKKRLWLRVLGVAFCIITTLYLVLAYALSDIGVAAGEEREAWEKLEAKCYYKDPAVYLASISVLDEKNAAPELEKLIPEFEDTPLDEFGDTTFKKRCAEFGREKQTAIKKLIEITTKPYCVFNARTNPEQQAVIRTLVDMSYIPGMLVILGEQSWLKGDRSTAMEYWRTGARLVDYIDDAKRIPAYCFRSASSQYIYEMLLSHPDIPKPLVKELLKVMGTPPTNQDIKAAMKAEYCLYLSQYDEFVRDLRGARVNANFIEWCLLYLPIHRKASFARMHQACLAFEELADKDDLRPAMLRINEVATRSAGSSYQFAAGYDAHLANFNFYSTDVLNERDAEVKLRKALENR